MNLRQLFFGVMIALALLTPVPPKAHAQTPDRLASLKISIWLEYDQPSALVLYDGVLADATNLPRPISILIPAEAQLFVTTWANADGSLAPEQPAQQAKQDDGYTRVTFVVAQPAFRVEYYHAALRGAPDKTFDFAFKSLGAVDALTVEFQQPLKASNFVVTPAAQSTRTDAEGFKYFAQTYANLAAGQTLTAQVKYTKTDPQPSVVQAQVAPPSGLPTWNGSSNLFLLFALVVVGLAILLGLFLLQQRALAARPVSGANQRRHKRRAASAATAFCTQCGRALARDDNFCPACGAARRVAG